jgi:uncharacterized YigZ family protein
MRYLVPTGFGEAELTEKRSRFIGHIWPVNSEEEAKALIQQTKSTYYDARHNCWCYIVREGSVLRYADDGEPQGTAGQPMLDMLRHQGVEDVLCVVTRYFGGILLGPGGLARAYAQTAKLALHAAGISEMLLYKRFELSCPYSLYERIRNDIESNGGVVENALYGTDVEIQAYFPENEAVSFSSRLIEMSSGAVTGNITGEKYVSVPKK